MHALNNLLQGSYYKDVADVACIINAENKNLAPTERAPSAADVLLGYVSVQVFCMVLAQHSLQLVRPEHEVRGALEAEQGFLCHHDTHCFTLRRLHDVWCSSLSKHPPPAFWLGRPTEALLPAPRTTTCSIQYFRQKNRWNLDSRFKVPQLIFPELLVLFLDLMRVTG